VQPHDGWTSDDVLRWAAAVEARSAHPLARAIVHAARDRKLVWADAAQFASIAGLGARAAVDGRKVLVGNVALMAANGVEIANRPTPAGEGSTVFVAVDGQLAGSMSFVDTPRPHAREVLRTLARRGIGRIVMLTGDRVHSARALADAIGLRELYAGLTPAQKLARIDALRGEGHHVAMVGDGVNDAPALALADVGVAMGAVGSDVALETADVALMGDELMRLPYVLELSRATVRTIRVNVALSLLVKAVFLLAAATGTATLWMAVVADTGASVVVVANALRLLRARSE
jgi:Cd2+/Zn2+-exporting ATPase